MFVINGDLFLKKLGNQAHRLDELAAQLPADIRNQIFNQGDQDMLKKRGDAFTSLRYSYEEYARVGSSSILREIAGEAIPRVVKIHRANQSADPWIHEFDSIRERARQQHGSRL
jgi:uncharacterized membrane protein YccC